MFRLKICYKIFYLIDNDYVKSGYGLDECWSIMLNNYESKSMAVIDYISVIHTREIGLFQKKKEKNFILPYKTFYRKKLILKKKCGRPLKKGKK